MDDKLDERSLSVTAADRLNPHVRYVYLQDFFGGDGAGGSMRRDSPTYWTPERDYALRATVGQESSWATAVGIAISRVASASFKVQGSVSTRVARAHRILQLADFGEGYRTFICKVVRDWLLTDNGAFVEVVRASPAPGSRIIGIAHLDSLRCYRTGDERVPVVYTDRKGIKHEMADHQVIRLVDMPGSGETGRGVGFCAASRAYNAIYSAWARETLISESTSGRTPTKLSFLSGLSTRAVEDALTEAKSRADAEQLRVYMGAAVTAVPSDKPLSLQEIALRQLPEGMDIEKERAHMWLQYANALGVDPQELQPLTGRAMGTATQSQVLDDKASGKGLSMFFGGITEQFNLRLMPEGVTFEFAENDMRDQQIEAQVREVRARTRAAMVQTGEISAEQARKMAVEAGDIPREVVPDESPGDVLTDADPLAQTTEQQIAEAFAVAVQQAVNRLPTTQIEVETAQAFAGAGRGPATQTKGVDYHRGPSTLCVMYQDMATWRDSNNTLRTTKLDAIPPDELARFSDTDRRALQANIKRRAGIAERNRIRREGQKDTPDPKGEKANRVMLAEFTPDRAYNRKPGSAYIVNLTNLLREYGRLLVLACKQEAPQSGETGESGKLVDSIRFAVVNPNTSKVSLRLYAGNAERPEVVVRSTLYGRRGFGPKDPDGVLAFTIAGQKIFAKRVGPAAANNWFQRAWDATEPQRRSLYARAGAMAKTIIAEDDVELSDAEHIDQ